MFRQGEALADGPSPSNIKARASPCRNMPKGPRNRRNASRSLRVRLDESHRVMAA